jgi:hypothetical protein
VALVLATVVAALIGVLEVARRPVALVAGGPALLCRTRGRDQRRTLGRQLGAAGEVGGTVEVLPALDPRLLAHRVGRQRLAAPDREVGVLPHLDRAHVLVDLERLRGIERHHLQRLVARHAAVLDGFRGLGVEPARQLVAVGVEAHVHAAIPHDVLVPRNRVDHLLLVAPPVGEAQRRGAGRGDLVRHLVALEDVRERVDVEAERLGEPDQHQDLVLTVAVAVDQPCAVDDLGERIQL